MEGRAGRIPNPSTSCDCTINARHSPSWQNSNGPTLFIFSDSYGKVPAFIIIIGRGLEVSYHTSVNFSRHNGLVSGPGTGETEYEHPRFSNYPSNFSAPYITDASSDEEVSNGTSLVNESHILQERKIGIIGAISLVVNKIIGAG